MSAPRASTRIMTDHVPNERLAEYSKGLLEEPHVGEVEEHLLICGQCRMRLTDCDNE
jgi:anti-sigma factor ChrR (cupin superfamily)